jgi:2-keto-4-pentenoate hydratase/2-oxohepta-3-ene-1,7-dioic acid hydratase in catechol pathway
MRLCRYRHQGKVAVGFYDEQAITPLQVAAASYEAAHGKIAIPDSTDLLKFLPGSRAAAAARELSKWLDEAGPALAVDKKLPTSNVELLVPVPKPNKILLLAGNYAKHIEEGGGKATERAETFPYVFMKPPTTTLTDPGKPIMVPRISPGAIDWELELAVIIGRRCKGVTESEALRYVAGYTVLNDISNRRFKPNPNRKQRERDNFFDWLHGKWHDSFCPCGPCIASSETITDPQQLRLKLTLNGEVKQDATTAQMIFPVAAVIEFIASFVTLEPGDIISTGTPEGVGHAKGTFLKAGDTLVGAIERIGELTTPVADEGE